jgi:hypothetical protein
VTEAEVGADAHGPCVQCPGQDLLAEVIGGLTGELRRERNRDQLVHAQRGDQLDLLVRGGQQPGRLVGAQHLERMGIERHHGRREATRASPLDGRTDHPPVPAMHAVEGAERECAARGGRSDV